MSLPLRLGRFQAFIFDLDGTLVDTLGDFVVALNLALADHQLPAVDRTTVEHFIGKGSEHLVRAVMAHVLGRESIQTSESVDLLRTYLDHYRHINGLHAPLFEGVPQGLEALSRRQQPMACVTNKPHGFARALLERKGIASYFSPVFGGDSFEQRKPHPMPLLNTCKVMGVAPEHTLMVGDSVNDALAARAAGCKAVLMSYGYNHGRDVRELLDQGVADAVVDRLDALAPLLD
jgi:phosphoglycolate phosphatase